jgi:2-keto-4-pentenoate hydratase/2-oxohepta-3-ene-1,7-dioic acid hydratase in catechol pathway
MRLCTYRVAGEDVTGLRLGGSFHPLETYGFADIGEFLAAASAATAEFASYGPGTPIGDDWELQPPVPRPPRNLFCIGTNYAAHYAEGDRPADTSAPTRPVVFSKPWTTLTAHGQDVYVDPEVTTQVDWEAEVAVVIGRGGRNIARDDALRHIFGLTLANDLSARDVQLGEGNLNQWFLGKAVDGFCPLGPEVVSLDELAISDVTFDLTVNGIAKQHGCLADLVFDLPHLVSFLSRYVELLPGDIILTGTPSGVGHWRVPKEFLGDGDTVTIRSPQLGTLENRIRHHRAGSNAGHDQQRGA